LNNPDTSINPDYYRKFNPDFTRDVVTPAEKNVAQKKVAAEAEKAATRRRSLAKLAPSGISFLSGLFGSKKNKKSNKKKSNKKKTK
ncbi:MAG: hypothetical protein CMG00_00020, partial [Candidatus Marinimicrobia bacterium]|nr:hypothetical protein [Candidatus Neomarinimicrobiota bacterium]